MDIFVIGGFLGAGKTSFVLRLARRLVDVRHRKVAIIENEAGKVGVDDARLRGEGLTVREVFGGCVCCSMGANLMVTLGQIEREIKPDVVILEPSGVASPGEIRQLLMSSGKTVARVRMAVLFDAERFKAFHRVAGPFIEDSLKVADVAVVNKVDLVDSAIAMDLVDRLVQMGGGKPVVAMSAKDGRGVEEVMRELMGENDDGDVFQRSTLTPALSLQGRGGGSSVLLKHSHNHAGEPGVYACEREMAFDRPRATATVAAEAAVMMERLAKAIDAHDGAVIGHVKASVRTDSGTLFISTTSSARPAEVSPEVTPQVTGVTDGMTRRAHLTLNVLAYRMSEGQLEAMVREICDL
ncbi:MAG: GTP-binding protein [Phycisphaerales bacterium]